MPYASTFLPLLETTCAITPCTGRSGSAFLSHKFSLWVHSPILFFLLPRRLHDPASPDGHTRSSPGCMRSIGRGKTDLSSGLRLRSSGLWLPQVVHGADAQRPHRRRDLGCGIHGCGTVLPGDR